METLYIQIGGDSVAGEIVKNLYKNVLSDDRLAIFFQDINMDLQQRKFRMFLEVVTGGPHHYSGLELRAAHSKVVAQGMSEEHLGYLLGHLKAAMEEQSIAPTLIEQVITRVEGYSSDVLGR